MMSITTSMLDVFKIVSESCEKYTNYWLIFNDREHYRDDYDCLCSEFFNVNTVKSSDCHM